MISEPPFRDEAYCSERVFILEVTYLHHIVQVVRRLRTSPQGQPPTWYAQPSHCTLVHTENHFDTLAARELAVQDASSLECAHDSLHPHKPIPSTEEPGSKVSRRITELAYITRPTSKTKYRPNEFIIFRTATAKSSDLVPQRQAPQLRSSTRPLTSPKKQMWLKLVIVYISRIVRVILTQGP